MNAAPLEALPNAADLRTALGSGRAVLVCESPGFRGGSASAAGDFVVSGFAAAAAGIDAIAIDIAGRWRDEARLGLRRPDARLVLGASVGAPAPGFEARVDTREWAPGTMEVTLRLQTRDGTSSAWTGRLHWALLWDDLVRDYLAALPALCWEHPVIGPDPARGDILTVRGWAASRSGVAAVRVDGPTGLREARLRQAVRARFPWARRSSEVLYSATLDLQGLPPGMYELGVTVVDNAGQSARRAGSLLVDPAGNYRAWKRAFRPPPIQRAPVPLRVCVVGDGRVDTSPLRGQSHEPVAVTATSATIGLESALRAFLAGHDADALLLVCESDVLDPDALARVGECFAADPPPDLVYADDDHPGADGEPCCPRLKPGWSPELFLARDLVGPLVAVGRDAARQALDGWKTPPASARDLVLRLVDAPIRAQRIPHVLSTRRGQAPGHPEAEAATLREIARRRGRQVRAEPTGTGPHRLRWPLPRTPLVSVVIPTLGRPDPLEACLRSVARFTAYAPFEVVLVESSPAGASAAVAEAALGAVPHRVIAYDASAGFNFSRAVNLGTAAARGELILFLNDDVEAVAPDWLDAMVEYGTLPSAGVVGARLLFPNGDVQHAGITLRDCARPGGWPPSQFLYAFPGTSPGPLDLMTTARDVAAVTGACALVPRHLLDSLGGWDEAFPLDWGDHDLCLRAIAAGRRVVVVPWATLIHRESTTRSLRPEPLAARVLFDRWGRRYRDGDPWSHPAFPPGRDYELEGLRGADSSSRT